SADHLDGLAEPAVVAVSTASRHLSPAEAGARVRQAALALAGRSPRIVFRKIDSRLKGNLESETRALLEVFP
ncbi:four-carbon acid sugar kinase family protein, partial [Streptococcus pneumoniae]|uniref:four-carbon acid sugar kinase family protein n=1 Tax=Streptococcus pneumoniae TaxID=1313 RepID=UPI0013DBDFC7